MMRSLTITLFAGLLAASSHADARHSHHARASAAPGQFDYYAVALSWSPSYCASHRDPGQCDSARPLGFVLHGLWPQLAKGYPDSCSSERLPAEVRARYSVLFPSAKMIDHEWQKHGTCSGQDAASYFALTARLKDQLLIPKQLQQPATPVRMSSGELIQAFKAANTGMVVNSVLPFCGDGGRFLREVHACYSKTGVSTSCSESEVKRAANSCRQQSFLVQSVR